MELHVPSIYYKIKSIIKDKVLKVNVLLYILFTFVLLIIRLYIHFEYSVEKKSMKSQANYRVLKVPDDVFQS